ncbi:MAG: IS5/IS1182 family transposase, partial [Serratia symbiotica]|nr:IS5/IS1182 family transposase [Serratia symbiotica]
MGNQCLTGDNTPRKSMTGYHRRSIAETAMYRVQQLFG